MDALDGLLDPPDTTHAPGSSAADDVLALSIREHSGPPSLPAEGCILSLAVRGMAGRGIAFEYNTAADCFEAAGALAKAGLMDDDVLSEAEQDDDTGMEGIACAVLDESVLASRFDFAFEGAGCNLVAWERCLRVEGDDPPTPAPCLTPGIMYVCEGGLIFLPDRNCKGGSRASLTAKASVFGRGGVERVELLFGGMLVTGVRLGARRATRTRFTVGLARDWEALGHAVHALVAGRGEERSAEEGGTEGEGGEEEAAREAAEEARGREWTRALEGRSAADLRADPHLLAAVAGRARPPAAGIGGAVPFRSAPGGGAGVPRSVREMLWLRLSRSDELRARYPGGYARRLLRPELGAGGALLDPELARAAAEIDKDVPRTFTTQDLHDCLRAVPPAPRAAPPSLFRSASACVGRLVGVEVRLRAGGRRRGRAARGRQIGSGTGGVRGRGAEWFAPKLRRVLLAFAQHNPAIGYCQSLNYLGGIIVIVVEAEEDCFWLLAAMLEFLLPKTYYADLSGVMVDVHALSALLERNLRAVKERLEMTHLPLTSFAAQWFMCAYVNVLSGAAVVRVWDCLFMEGAVVLFRVALALLKAIEGELGVATEMEDAVGALQRARTLEIETVLQIAQSCFGAGVVDLSDLMQLRSQALSASRRR